MAKNIFRKEAVEKLVVSEELNSHINLIRPGRWLILLAVSIIFLCAVIWGITGRIQYRVTGEGILLNTNNIMMLQAPSTGRVIILEIKPGDTITKGQIIARIAQPKIEKKIKLLVDKIDILKQNLNDINRLNNTKLRKEIVFYESKENNCNREIDNLEKDISWLESMVVKYKKLRTKGAISEIKLHEEEKDLNSLKVALVKKKNELQDISFKKFESINELKKEALKYKTELDEKILELDELKFDLQSQTIYKSPTSGKVLEVSVNLFQLVEKGDKFLTLSSNQKEQDLKAILYLPVSKGKSISNGMPVKIAPSTVKTSEYGYIKGIVEHVGEYPVSKEGMENTLQNKELVEKLSRGGTPIKVIISLSASSKNPSGLQWTSSDGPPVKIQNGTLCKGKVIVKESIPVTLVLPAVKYLFYDEK